MSLLRSLLFTDPLIVLVTMFMGTVSLVVSLFDRLGDTQHQVARVWSRMLLAIAGVKVRVYGLEKLNGHGNCILVANHQSYLDTPLVMGNVPLQFRFFANENLFHVPFLGTHLRRAGHLPVVGGDPRASLRSIQDAARLLKQRGISVLLFPEGGRTLTRMREFKEGAAYLAIKAGLPVVPLGIRGTRDVLPMGSVCFRPRILELHVGSPVVTDGLKMKDRESLTHLLEEKVGDLCGESLPKGEFSPADNEIPKGIATAQG
jgi:1-acyl-sn-glycerol-3-phosphate acyltransferase